MWKGSVFRKIIGAAKVERNRAAASTQALCGCVLRKDL